MTLNECPDIYSLIQLDPEHQTSSLILIKSMARHFKSIEIDEDANFEQFCSFFLRSALPLFIDSQNYTDILLIFNAFYYLICNHPSYFKNLDSEVIIAIISKFIFLSEFQNDEVYQQCLKHASKTILLLFIKSIIPTDISSELLISIFTIILQLYTEDLKPSTRNQLTKLICKLFDYQLIAEYFFSDLENIIDSIFLPFFMSTENKVELYENYIDSVFDLYDPYNYSIYLMQFLSNKFTDFVEFLNSYLNQFIQHVLDNQEVDDEIMSLLAHAKLAASSLHLSDESILEFPLYESPNEIIRFIGFTIAANYSDILPPFLFPVCLEHFNDESETVCRLSAISAIKCLENEELDFDESETGFLPQLFEAYLIITEDPESISISTLKLLTRLLDLSDNPGIFSNQILSSLLTRLVQISNDENSNGQFVNEIVKKICQVLILNSMNDSESDSNFDTDSFTSELISIYENFNSFFKEQILSIFEILAEFCFSPEITWNIVNVFEFGNIFDDEMMVLRKLLISAKINDFFEMDAIEYIFSKLFEKIENEKIENDIMSAFDDETVLNSLSDVISSLFGLNNENIDLCIYQEIVPLILTWIQMNIQDISAPAVSRLISCIFIFFDKSEKEFDYQPFIDFWIDNTEYPYFCASSIAIFQNLTYDLDLSLVILLKLCDELNDFYIKIDDQQSSDEFEFPEFTFRVIIADFLNLIKSIKDELPEFYQIFHQKAETFLNEILPQIVDCIC